MPADSRPRDDRLIHGASRRRFAVAAFILPRTEKSFEDQPSTFSAAP